MSNPVDQIKKILDTRPKPASGEIVIINGNSISVRTIRGIVVASNANGLTLSEGQHVLVVDGIVKGTVRHPDQVPVYPV